MASEWLKFKTKTGKALCKAAVVTGCYNQYINYDDMAEKYPAAGPGDIKKIQDAYIKAGAPGLTVNGEKIGRPSAVGDTQYEKNLAARLVKNSDSFPDFILESGAALPEDLESQKKLYKDTIAAVTDKFLDDNKDLIEKPQKYWVNKFYVTIKTSIPKIPVENIELIDFVYDIYSVICYNLGILPSINGFCIFSGVDYWIIKDMVNKVEGLNPAYSRFVKKALNQTENNLVNKLMQHDGANTNVMFLLNTCFGYDKKTIIQHISNNNTSKQVDDIPLFDDTEK